MDPIQMSSFRQECGGLLEKEAGQASIAEVVAILGALGAVGPAAELATEAVIRPADRPAPTEALKRLGAAFGGGALGGFAAGRMGPEFGKFPAIALGSILGGYAASRAMRQHLEKEANIAAKWKAIQAGGKWFDPRRWAKGFGLGVEQTGKLIQAPLKTTQEGWAAMGSMGGRGGWTGTGKNPFTGKASKAWGWTRNVPVGMKGMTAGFAGHGVYSGAKKQDPYGENRSRTERVMGAVGGGLGWAAMPFGMVPALTTSILAEKGLSAVGKGIHGAGQAAKSMSSRRKALQAQGLQARAAQYAQSPEVRAARNRAAALAASRAAAG